MNTGINIAILDNQNFVSLLPNIAKNFEVGNIELPVQFCQRLHLQEKQLKGLCISGLSGLLNKTDILPMSIFSSEELFLQQMVLLQSKLDMASILKCKNMSLGIDPFIDHDNLNYAEGIFIDRVKYCATLAAKVNININLEYICHNVVLNSREKQKIIFCDSINKAIKLIETIALDNVNLLLDLLHWYCDKNRPVFEDFASYIGFVHICDHKQTNPKKINDFERVLPGEGNLPIEPFINCLKNSKYKGFSTIEVFRNDLYQPSDVRIKNSLLYIKRLWSKEL